MSAKDDISELIKDLEKYDDNLTRLRDVQRANIERDRYKGQVKVLEQDLLAATERLNLYEQLGKEHNGPPPVWLTKSTGKAKLYHGMPMLVLSDCHFDEVVRPEEVEGLNSYNRKIAVQRLERTLDRVNILTRDFFHGLKYDGFVLLLGGDMLSGAIHEELTETNEDTVYSSLDFWSGQIAGFINGLERQFGKVHCVGVVGNHGRRTRKPVAKRRVRDNLDWLLYRMVARSTPNVTWDIPDSADVELPVYSTRFRLTHGDQFRGGSGIAGMLSPIMLGHHRKAQQQMAIGKAPFDWLVMGHWHQYFQGRGIIVNGALKGYDEYAYVNNFRYEPPQQAFFLVSPEHGCAFSAPVFCGDRKKEGW